MGDEGEAYREFALGYRSHTAYLSYLGKAVNMAQDKGTEAGTNISTGMEFDDSGTGFCALCKEGKAVAVPALG